MKCSGSYLYSCILLCALFYFKSLQTLKKKKSLNWGSQLIGMRDHLLR